MKLRKNSVLRVLRGGGYPYGTRSLCVAYREWSGSGRWDWNSGFRFVVRRQE